MPLNKGNMKHHQVQNNETQTLVTLLYLPPGEGDYYSLFIGVWLENFLACSLVCRNLFTIGNLFLTEGMSSLRSLVIMQSVQNDLDLYI